MIQLPKPARKGYTKPSQIDDDEIKTSHTIQHNHTIHPIKTTPQTLPIASTYISYTSWMWIGFICIIAGVLVYLYYGTNILTPSPTTNTVTIISSPTPNSIQSSSSSSNSNNNNNPTSISSSVSLSSSASVSISSSSSTFSHISSSILPSSSTVPSSSSSSIPSPLPSASTSSALPFVVPFGFNTSLNNYTTIQTAPFITPTDYNNPFAGNKIQVYSYLGVLIDIPNNWGSKSWFPAINRHLTTGQGYVIMACVGDSITAGYFTLYNNLAAWCIHEGYMLRQQIPGLKDGGNGWTGVFRLVNPTSSLPIFGTEIGGTANLQQGGSGSIPTHSSVYTTNAGTAFISWAVRGKYVDVYLYPLNGCNFNWTIDNGNSTYQMNLTPQQFSDSSGSLIYIRTYMPPWTNTTQWQKFTLTKQTPSLTCSINVVGVRGLNDNGLVVDIYGFPGESGQYENVVYQCGTGAYALNIQPDLCRWQYGVNDAAQSIANYPLAPDTGAMPYVVATLATMTSQINLTHTDFLVNIPAIGSYDTTVDFMSMYEFPVVNYSSRTGLSAFVSQTAIYSLGNIHTDVLLQSLGGFPTGEGVHPSIAGLQMYAKNVLFLLSGGRAGNLPNSTTWQNRVDYTIFPKCSQYCLQVSQTSPYAQELCGSVGGTLNTGTATTPSYNCPV